MGSRFEGRAFACLTLERMLAITVPRIEPEIEREKSQSVSPVLIDVDHLVAPHHVGRLAREHDDVAERDRDVAATREDAAREATIAYVEEAAVSKTRRREREKANDMSDEVGVMPDQVTGCWRRSAPPRQ